MMMMMITEYAVGYWTLQRCVERTPQSVTVTDASIRISSATSVQPAASCPVTRGPASVSSRDAIFNSGYDQDVGIKM